MYRLFSLLFFLPSVVIGIEVNPMLKCLAQEEAEIHRQKIYGHRYNLNQSFLNELAGATLPKIQTEYIEKICGRSQFFGPTENLLILLLLEGKKIFALQKNDQRPLEQASVEALLLALPPLFFQYLLDLQYESGVAGCLPKKIPALKEFTEQFQYLESDLSAERLLENKERIRQIFVGLQKMQEYRKECQREQQELEKKKEAKEQKAESKSPPQFR